MLIDNHGRIINYVRLAVTDRCNLRCTYCMPERGIQFLPRNDLLSYEEMLRMTRIFAELGVEKIRITGGEPFVRRDIMPFIRQLSKTEGINKIVLTTNGTLTEPFIPELKKCGVSSVNLSLDSLDAKRFYEVTRRDEFDKVWSSFLKFLEYDIKVKINTVVMSGKNDADIVSLVELTKKYPVSVRFIEEMPFNGVGNHDSSDNFWSWQKILQRIKTHFPSLEKIPDEPHSTSYNYAIEGHQGTVGIIAAYSRTFCGTCNRLRVTPQGDLRTCLYDSGVFNLRDLMRQTKDDERVKVAIREAVAHRAKDGFEAEKNRKFEVHESMTTIGG